MADCPLCEAGVPLRVQGTVEFEVMSVDGVPVARQTWISLPANIGLKVMKVIVEANRPKPKE